MWGLDLSGSAQGAGGVGGLLAVTYTGAQTTNCFVAFDGNGNVAALADAGSTNILAQYEYGPFGEVLRATGPMAKANPFRFSTKYQDDETDLLYYGYRYYNSGTGRWLSRDPAEEWGSFMLYSFVANDPQSVIDDTGLFPEDLQHLLDGSEIEGSVGLGLAVGANFKTTLKQKSCCSWEAGFSAKVWGGIGVGVSGTLSVGGRRFSLLDASIKGPRLEGERSFKVTKNCDGSYTGLGKYKYLDVRPGYFSVTLGAGFSLEFIEIYARAKFIADIGADVGVEIYLTDSAVTAIVLLEGEAKVDMLAEVAAKLGKWQAKKSISKSLFNDSFRKILATASVRFP